MLINWAQKGIGSKHDKNAMYTVSQKNETLVFLNILYSCKSTAMKFSMQYPGYRDIYRRLGSSRRQTTCLEQSSNSLCLSLCLICAYPWHFLLSKHTWSHICSTYPSLQFDCIIDYFLYRALEAACGAYASLNLSLLHDITLYITR